MTKIHFLKTAVQWFNLFAYGDKNVEIRKNDRNFRDGDLVVLIKEGSTPDDLSCICRRIRHVFDKVPGLVAGYVLLTFNLPTSHEMQSMRKHAEEFLREVEK